jgi:hypothetical protein
MQELRPARVLADNHAPTLAMGTLPLQESALELPLGSDLSLGGRGYEEESRAQGEEEPAGHGVGVCAECATPPEEEPPGVVHPSQGRRTRRKDLERVQETVATDVASKTP